MKGMITSQKTGDLLSAGVGAAIQDCAAQVVQYPLIGGEIRQHLGGNRDRFWPQEAKNMIRACGVAVKQLDVDPDTDIVTVR